MKAKETERLEARKLRKRGFSLNAIANKVWVSKSTVSQKSLFQNSHRKNQYQYQLLY